MQVVGEELKRAKTVIVMAYDDFDLEAVEFPHDDLLVRSPIIEISVVK